VTFSARSTIGHASSSVSLYLD